jgi:hypothetical protein
MLEKNSRRVGAAKRAPKVKPRNLRIARAHEAGHTVVRRQPAHVSSQRRKADRTIRHQITAQSGRAATNLVGCSSLGHEFGRVAVDVDAVYHLRVGLRAFEAGVPRAGVPRQFALCRGRVARHRGGVGADVARAQARFVALAAGRPAREKGRVATSVRLLPHRFC